MSYEFQSMLYSSPKNVIDAVANEWLTAGGDNGDTAVREVIASWTDDALADECIEGWKLDVIDPEQQRIFDYSVSEDDKEAILFEFTPLGGWDCNRADLVAAFGRLRAEWAETEMTEANA